MATATDRVQDRIETKLVESFDLKHLEVVNESNQHNVPPGSESHFKVVLVSDDFSEQRRIARHRSVNSLLAEELAGPVHALSIHAFTLEEWRERHGSAPLSPPCLGGSKADQTSGPAAAS